MSEILIDYFKGFKNYFKDFDKPKFYHILKVILLISVLICFNVISIPLFLMYKFGQYIERKKFKDILEKKTPTPTYLSGIHTDKSSELISISEVNLPNNQK